MIRRLVLVSVFLSAPALVHAQAPVVQPSVTAVRFVVSGGVSPVTNDLPVGAMTGPVACLPAVPTNGTAFDYKVNATDTQCWRYVDPGTGPLLSLPVGGTSYTATLAYVNSNGAGPASAASAPFSRPGTAPTTAPLSLTIHQ